MLDDESVADYFLRDYERASASVLYLFDPRYLAG